MRSRKQRLHSAELRQLINIAAALDRIAIAIEKRPTTEIGRIDVGQGVGVQDGGTTEINSNNTKIKNNIDKSQSSISGDHGASATGVAIATIASGVSPNSNNC